MKLKVAIGAVAVAILVLAVYESVCACVTLVEIAHTRLQTEIGRALAAEQAFYAQYRRFAPTLDALGYVADSTTDLRVFAASDSSIIIRGTWVELPDVSCALEMTPATRAIDRLLCNR